MQFPPNTWSGVWGWAWEDKQKPDPAELGHFPWGGLAPGTVLCSPVPSSGILGLTRLGDPCALSGLCWVYFWGQDKWQTYLRPAFPRAREWPGRWLGPQLTWVTSFPLRKDLSDVPSSITCVLENFELFFFFKVLLLYSILLISGV